jgi:hypothetical protein
MHTDNKLPIILGVTGHRNIKEKDYDNLKSSVRKIFDSLEDKYSSTPIILLTPLADGADRLVAKVALEEKYLNKIKIVIPLPFDEDIYKDTFGKGIFKPDNDEFIKKSIQEYEDLKNKILLDKRDFKHIISLEFDRKEYDNVSDDEKRNIRRKLYTKVGEFIAIHSNILIALENPNSDKKEGGAKEIVQKKLSGEYEYFNSENTLIQPEKGLVYRIITPRDGYDLKDTYEIFKLFPKEDSFEDVNWNKKEDKKKHKFSDKFQDFIETIFSKPCLKKFQSKNINEYRKHHYHLNCLNKEIEGLESNLEKKELTKLENIRTLMSKISGINNNKVKSLEKWISLFLIFITAITAFKFIFPDLGQNIITFTYPILVLVFYIFILYIKKYKSLSEDTRALSEGLRVQLIWNKLEINESVAFYYSIRDKNELDWIRSTLRTLNIFSYIDIQKESKNFNERKEDIKKDWIDKQKDYFKDKIKKYKKEEEKYNNKSDFLIILITTFIIIMGLIDSLHFVDSTNIVYLFIKCIIGLFSIELTRIKAKQYFDGYDRIIKQYEISLQNFERASFLLSDNNRSNEEYKKIIKKLGEEALIENSFWTILRREREYKAPSLK